VRADFPVVLDAPFVLKPLVAAAIDMQQHPRQGPPRAPLAMHPTLASPRHQPGALQHPFHPAIAEPDRMLAGQLLAENAAD